MTALLVDRLAGGARTSLRWRALPRVVLLLACGCYHVQLLPPQAPIVSERLPIQATVVIPAETARYEHAVRSGMAGFANSWTIEVGQAVSAYADAYLGPLFEPGEQVHVRIDVVSFVVKDMAATTDLRFTVSARTGTIFEQTYRGRGDGRGGIVFGGGAFAMKAAMRGTTHEALRACFEQFVDAARAEYPKWRRGAGVAAGTEGAS